MGCRCRKFAGLICSVADRPHGFVKVVLFEAPHVSDTWNRRAGMSHRLSHSKRHMDGRAGLTGARRAARGGVPMTLASLPGRRLVQVVMQAAPDSTYCHHTRTIYPKLSVSRWMHHGGHNTCEAAGRSDYALRQASRAVGEIQADHNLLV